VQLEDGDCSVLMLSVIGFLAHGADSAVEVKTELLRRVIRQGIRAQSTRIQYAPRQTSPLD
jgi:hypothetical protein